MFVPGVTSTEQDSFFCFFLLFHPERHAVALFSFASLPSCPSSSAGWAYPSFTCFTHPVVVEIFEVGDKLLLVRHEDPGYLRRLLGVGHEHLFAHETTF